jgi:hypothetical protein
MTRAVILPSRRDAEAAIRYDKSINFQIQFWFQRRLSPQHFFREVGVMRSHAYSSSDAPFVPVGNQ